MVTKHFSLQIGKVIRVSKYNENKWVAASDVGRAAFCAHSLEHKNKGSAISKTALVARNKGKDAHDNFNKIAEDKRCYIASYLYGIDDARTVLLRNFRDESLKKNCAGRIFISFYYRVSPYLVCLAKTYPSLCILLNKGVDEIVERLRNSSDAF